jgi:hypothetical protein
MADGMTVSMSLVLIAPDHSTVEITKPENAELYPETRANAGYDKCIAPPALEDRAAARIDGLWDMQGWAKANDANIVIIHTSGDPALLALGSTGRIGLTSDSPFFKTITKKYRVLTDDPLKPLTVDDLQRMGYVP